MACGGDVPTLEMLAAVSLLREGLPDLRIRVVNVVDLMTLQPQSDIRTALRTKISMRCSPRDKPVIFAFHGYPSLIHRLTYRRHNHDNIHVRGYKEEGTTTTPFDMCVLNNMDRFQLALDAIRRVPRLGLAGRARAQWYSEQIQRHKLYVAEHGEDMPKIRQWHWAAHPTSLEESIYRWDFLAAVLTGRAASRVPATGSSLHSTAPARPEDLRGPSALKERGTPFMSSLPVLVLNSGSSSIKFSICEAGTTGAKALRRRGGRHRDRPGQVLDQGCGRQEARRPDSATCQSRRRLQTRRGCVAFRFPLRRRSAIGWYRAGRRWRRTSASLLN